MSATDREKQARAVEGIRKRDQMKQRADTRLDQLMADAAEARTDKQGMLAVVSASEGTFAQADVDSTNAVLTAVRDRAQALVDHLTTTIALT